MARKNIRLCENIKILRNKNNLTQQILADQLHITRQTLSAWEQSVSKPDIESLARLSEIFDLSTDELLFGKIQSIQNMKYIEETLFNEPVDYISSICKKGFYDILEEDIQNFFPIIYIRFARIMGIARELKERGYNIISLYGNGFSIYFSSDEEASNFSNVLYDIIDCFMHYEIDKTVVSHSEKLQEKIDEVEVSLINQTYEALWGHSLNDMYYWIDEYDCIRGYGITADDCKMQAEVQGCTKYNILHE